jgi:hypothetical protein
MPAISGAFYPQGKPRGRDNALGVSLLILDFDNSREEPTGEFYADSNSGQPTGRPKVRKVCIDDPVTMEEVTAALERAGVASVTWTTWSCTPEHEKFRVVVPLTEPVPIDLWERAADFALGACGLAVFRRGLDLPVLHNPAALAFLPGSPTPEAIRRSRTSGTHLYISPDELPASWAPALAPWQAEVMESRVAEWSRGERWFQAYRVDGRPVDFMHLDLVPILEARGVKVGPPRPFKDGTKRRARCPWASEHSGGVDDDSAVLIHTPGTWPTFKCKHSGHQHMGLRDLIEWAWGKP